MGALKNVVRSEGGGLPKKAYENVQKGRWVALQRTYVRSCSFHKVSTCKTCYINENVFSTLYTQGSHCQIFLPKSVIIFRGIRYVSNLANFELTEINNV